MEQRPVLQLELTRYDRILEGLAIAGLAGLWGMISFAYRTLPDTIPMHYNMQGEMDRMGNKQEIWWLAIIASIIYVVMTLLNRYPHKFNYMVRITPENALQQYRMGTRIIRFLKMAVMLIFCGIVYFMSHPA